MALVSQFSNKGAGTWEVSVTISGRQCVGERGEGRVRYSGLVVVTAVDHGDLPRCVPCGCMVGAWRPNFQGERGEGEHSYKG